MVLAAGFVVLLVALVAPALVGFEANVDFDVEAVERVLRDEPFDFPPPTGSASPAALTALPAVVPTSPTARPTVFVTFLMILPGSGIGSPSNLAVASGRPAATGEQTPCRDSARWGTGSAWCLCCIGDRSDPTPAGASKKRERQYEHIKESYRERGVSKDEAEERAARTVNKQRRKSGETKKKK